MTKWVTHNRAAWGAALGSLCALGLVACGGGDAKRPKTSDEAVVEETSEERASGMSISSEIGGLNQEAVDRVFAKASNDLRRCLGDGAERVEFLGGDVEFIVKIGSDGRVSHAHLEVSTIGDRATEVCMLDALKRRSWPKPIGGETGIAQKPFSFDMINDVRPPTEWSPDSIEEALGEITPKLDDCRSGKGSFTITMYVDTDGSVMSVGIAHAEDSGESAVDCILGVVKTVSYPSPGSWPAKVTFSL